MNEFLENLNKNIKKKRSPKYSAISLFCGGGGLDLGLHQAGFSPKFSTDIEKEHCETIAHNFNQCVSEPVDVKLIDRKYIKEKIGVGEIDLISGGPPCQAFSILGNRDSFDDPRGQLVYEYLRIIKELQPKAFIFENVPGLLTVNGGKDWKTLLATFKKKLGYKLYFDVLNSADFGVPQIRKRVILVGFRDHNVEFNFPKPKWKNDWLPSALAMEHINDDCPNHRKRPHSDRVKNRYKKLPPGERDQIDRTDRIHPNRPSGTVLVGSKSGGGRPFIHPTEPRHITVREAARLQSFPDWYEFQGTNTWQYRAVGNAVPPLMAKAVGDSIRKALESQ